MVGFAVLLVVFCLAVLLLAAFGIMVLFLDPTARMTAWNVVIFVIGALLGVCTGIFGATTPFWLEYAPAAWFRGDWVALVFFGLAVLGGRLSVFIVRCVRPERQPLRWDDLPGKDEIGPSPS